MFSVKVQTLLVFDSFKMLLSALFFLVSGAFAFYPVPRYGDIYNPFFTHFAANQWLQPYYYRQINNNPYLFHSDENGYSSSAPAVTHAIGMGSPAVSVPVEGRRRQNYPQWSHIKIKMKGSDLVCGGTITRNNSNWQSVAYSSAQSASSCAVTIATDFNRQRRNICQVRLDFAFSITQPNAESVCSTDTFKINGAKNKVPTLCGDASGQHMYLDVARVDEVKLVFNFGMSSAIRSWDFKIALLPCGASYLAPNGCLQYFTTAVGTFHSFNWRDTTGTATRQLADMDYQVCFRSEIVSENEASTLCLIPCTVVSGGNPFSISTANSAADGAVGTLVTGQSQNLAANCNNDYAIFPGGYNPAISLLTPTNALDRFCGEFFNPAAESSSSSTVCTTVKPFGFLYRTNGDETTTPTVDGGAGANGNGNQGFCFTFQEHST